MPENPAARPRLIEVIPLIAITPIVAVIVAWPVFGPGAIMAGVIAVPASAVIGAPVLHAALARGWRSFGRVTLLGALTGPLPFLLWGLFVAFADMRFRPTFAFLVFEALSAVIGAATGAVNWLLVLRQSASIGRRSAAARIAAVLGIAVLLVNIAVHWPERVWPKFRERRQHLELAWDFGPGDSAGAREVRVWDPRRPDCVASLYVPEVTAHVDRIRPATLPMDLVHVTSSWRLTDVRVDRIGPVVSPTLSTSVNGCVPWRNGTRR